MPSLDDRGLGGAAAVNLVAGVVGASVNLLMAAVVARHLGVAAAGTYFLVVAVFTIASNTVELGADTGLVRFVSAARAGGRPGEVPNLVRAAVRPVLGAVALLVVGTTALVLLGDDRRLDVPGWVLVLAASAAGALALSAVLLGLSRGFHDAVTYPVLMNLVLPVGRMTGIGLAVLAGWGLAGVLAAWLSPALLVLALSVIAARRVLRTSPRRERPASDAGGRPAKDFWRFSAARGVTACVEILLEWIDVLLVGALTSPAHAGVYAIVTRCVRASEIVHQVGRIVTGPRISAALARGDLEHARELHGVVTAAMIWTSWPFFILLAVFGDQVLRVFGPGFSDGALSMTLLAAAMAVATAGGTVQTILLMGGRSSWQLADKSAALVVNVVLDLLLIPVWGIEGAAVAWAVTIVLDTAIACWQVQRTMGVRPSGGHVIPAMVQPLLLVAIPALMVRWLLGTSAPVLVVSLALMAVVYLGTGFVTRRSWGLSRLLTIRSTLVAH